MRGSGGPTLHPERVSNLPIDPSNPLSLAARSAAHEVVGLRLAGVEGPGPRAALDVRPRVGGGGDVPPVVQPIAGRNELTPPTSQPHGVPWKRK